MNTRIVTPPATSGHSPKLSRTVREALHYLAQVRNYAPATIDSYQASSDLFGDFLHAQELPDEVRHFTGHAVRQFAEALAGRGQKPSTIVIRLSALSTIANTLIKLKDGRGKPYLTQNPTRTFEWPTVDVPETKFLLPDELAAFLAVERPLRESIARDLLGSGAPSCAGSTSGTSLRSTATRRWPSR